MGPFLEIHVEASCEHLSRKVGINLPHSSGSHAHVIGNFLRDLHARRAHATRKSRKLVLARAVSATPSSIVIAALVLGGPERVRVVFHSSSKSRMPKLGNFPLLRPVQWVLNSRACA